MPRRQYMGASEVSIPVDAILREYAAWSEEIVKAVSDELLKEVRARARTAFADETGTLRKRIRKRKSKLDKDTTIVGAFAPHAHLIEFGHDVTATKKGDVIGHAEAHPFLAPSEESVRGRLNEIIKGVVAPTVEVKR